MAGKDGRKKKQKSQNSDKASKPKRRGLGAKIKGLVMGRTKKKKQNSDLNSFTLQDYDPNGASRESILERSIEVDRNSYAGQTTPQRKKDLMRDQISPISMDKAFKGASKEELSGSISLVLLLVDPNSFRFELLQLEFEAPQNASVNDVLQQIKGSVTEPALQKLTFCALADRTGNAHEKEAPLEEALTRRTHNNDILAALCEGITADECSKLARPILSDEKVVDMVRGKNRTGDLLFSAAGAFLLCFCVTFAA